MINLKILQSQYWMNRIEFSKRIHAVLLDIPSALRRYSSDDRLFPLCWYPYQFIDFTFEHELHRSIIDILLFRYMHTIISYALLNQIVLHGFQMVRAG